MTQFVMSLKTLGRFTFDDLVLHEGVEQAVSTIRAVFGKGFKPPPALFLYGPEGTGKTHILKALITDLRGNLELRLGTPEYTAPRIGEHGVPILEGPLFDEEKTDAPPFGVAVDDVHLWREKEAARLWSLFNKLMSAGGTLLTASRFSPESTFPYNAHLTSRMLAGLVFELTPPPDSVRPLIVDKLARDRNVQLSQNVSRYLVTRTARNIKELERIIDLLDSASLEYKRRITIPFIKLLEEQGVL